jgi:hypothetical protein
MLDDGLEPTGRKWEYHGDVWREFCCTRTGGLVRIRTKKAKPPNRLGDGIGGKSKRLTSQRER